MKIEEIEHDGEVNFFEKLLTRHKKHRTTEKIISQSQADEDKETEQKNYLWNDPACWVGEIE